MEIGEKQGNKPTGTKTREANVNSDELEAMLRGKHVFPYVRELFGQERDSSALPTLDTCPSEVILPEKFTHKIAEMTRGTLKDTRERSSFGYLENGNDPLSKVRYHLERKSKRFSYYVKKGDRAHISRSIDDLVVSGVKIPLVSIHTHPDVPGITEFISMDDVVTFLDTRPIPFDIVSQPWGTTLLVKCREFFDGPIYSFYDLYRDQLERLRKIWDYYRQNLAPSELHSTREEFLAAICGQYGIAYYASNRFNESDQPLTDGSVVSFTRVNPWSRLEDLQKIEQAL